LRALEVVQREVWATIREAYQPEDLSVPHQFQCWRCEKENPELLTGRTKYEA
ncbi:Ubiquitin carboxyl-terminal hydrolase 47, partial [Manis javanica]